MGIFEPQTVGTSLSLILSGEKNTAIHFSLVTIFRLVTRHEMHCICTYLTNATKLTSLAY